MTPGWTEKECTILWQCSLFEWGGCFRGGGSLRSEPRRGGGGRSLQGCRHGEPDVAAYGLARTGASAAAFFSVSADIAMHLCVIYCSPSSWTIVVLLHGPGLASLIPFFIYFFWNSFLYLRQENLVVVVFFQRKMPIGCTKVIKWKALHWLILPL